MRTKHGGCSMSYQGMMDGWHGDENECHGQCGLCDECDRIADERADYEYDLWCDEEAA
jgi:hypothetical protein